MPLDPAQSAPGNRYSGPDGKEYDIVARVATDQGAYVVTRSADGDDLAPGALISEGSLRDNEDVEHVGTTAAAKAEAFDKAQEEEKAERLADRQARIDATNAKSAENTGATGATGSDENAGDQPASPTPTA